MKLQGKYHTLSDEREAALNQIGFVWDSHKHSWDKFFSDLCAFRDEFGHCNVRASNHYAKAPRLLVWIKSQRHHYRLFCDGQDSNMTHERVQKLKSIGFDFAPRQKNSL